MRSKKAFKGMLVALVMVALAASAVMLASCGGQQSSSSSSSSASGSVSAPNVVSLQRSDAEKAIVAAGLEVGNVTAKPSDTVASGHIISQSPEPLSMVKAGSAIDLVISTGKAQLKDVTVPNLTGMTQAAAEKALADVGLVGVASNPEETTAVAPGLVFKQSVAAGATAKEQDRIAFTVALAVSTVDVPNVTGKTQQDAEAALKNASLGFDITTAYNASVAKGNVISQSIAAGNKVKAGTTVTICVSLGQKPAENVTVPNVITYSWSDAEYALNSAGLKARFTGDPTGIVVAQDIASGTQVAPGTLVTVTLLSQVEKVAVPSLIGLSVTSAEGVTDSMGLSLTLDKSSGEHGTIVDQKPEAGTMVDYGTTIRVSVDDSEFK